VIHPHVETLFRTPVLSVGVQKSIRSLGLKTKVSFFDCVEAQVLAQYSNYSPALSCQFEQQLLDVYKAELYLELKNSQLTIYAGFKKSSFLVVLPV